MTQTRQLAAIMFTDIVGYTALMGNDEQKAFELLRKNREIQKPIIEEFGGRWIKELGDGVMATFPAVSNAVNAAIRIQEVCRNANAFELRIGIHLGEVVFENDDIFGDAVNIASRLQSLARPSTIYVSASVQRDVMNKPQIGSEFIGVEQLKNVREPVQIYRIFPALSVAAAKEALPHSSIVPEFNYDIQISYRLSDNKYDGWVGEFVEKLKQELDSTLKDKLSIYFDRNPPEDPGTAGQSIKSLLFIPVVSQTYCDTNSYPWIREFREFKKSSESDSVGRMVKLPNGNVSSRILPVKIHDIEIEDTRLLETELDGVLRSVDFIYRDAGVNRPLRAVDDDPGTTSGRVLYRNQINKLANAIKEIVQGIKLKERGIPVSVSHADITARQIIPTTFTTSLPSAIKVQVIDRQRPSIYLAWTSSDLKEQREELAIVLQKAGFNVLPSTDCPADDEAFKKRVAEEMTKCSCSLHMLSGEFGRRFEANDEMSFPQYQFMEAKKRIDAQDEDFNTFIWLYPEASGAMKPAQQSFIKYIRNNITRNMMFSNSQGPMQLVDDIRVVMMKQEEAVFDSKDTDIFFIFNQQDEQDAMLITDQLSSEYPVEIMNILPDGEDQYREMSTQQIPKSKLAVVYFKYAADWALPFIKQIWKQVGGASSPTPLFLVGEDDPRSNLARNFKAPKVVSTIVPKEEIPAEVKKVYTTVIKLK